MVPNTILLFLVINFIIQHNNNNIAVVNISMQTITL